MLKAYQEKDWQDKKIAADGKEGWRALVAGLLLGWACDGLEGGFGGAIVRHDTAPSFR